MTENFAQSSPAGVTLTMYRSICIVIFACVIAAGLADPEDLADAANIPCEESTRCTVNSVKINPCGPHSRNKQGFCIIKHGVNASINFDITPDFSASELETEASWNSIPFGGLDKDACPHTACPVTKGVTQPVSFSLYIGRKISTGSFQVKWKVWNKSDPSDLCCFYTKLMIKKK